MEMSEASMDSKILEDDSQMSRMESESSNNSADSDVVTCYCQKPRNLGGVEIQCSTCVKWFHSECVSCDIGKCIPFMANYHFCCKNCNPNGLEKFQKKPATFTQICYTALASLTHGSKVKGEMQVMFSKDKEIIPYIDKNWEDLTTTPRRNKLTWHTTIYKTLAKEVDLFLCEETSLDTMFGLISQDLLKIGPCFDLLIASLSKTGTPVPEIVSTKGRSAKRKTPFDSQFQPGSKQKKSEMSMMKLPLRGYPLEHPFNKDGYRYILAEPDPHAPNKQAFDESLDWAGKPIPGYLYRTYLANEVYLALHDRAPQLRVAEDRLTVTGDKGYSMIRATHGVKTGDWYFEVTVKDMPAESAVRIGWSQSLGNLQAPCGYDKFSYSWRSRKGTRFHQSIGKRYSDGFGRKDVLGFYISLPSITEPEKLLPSTHKDQPLVKFKSHLYYEEKDHVADTVKSLKPTSGSKMVMYKNGKSQGLTFSDVFEGVYFPAVSLYRNSTVTCNFGPNFKYPPKDLQTYKPISDAASEAMIHSSLADILFHIENEGKTP